MCRPSIQETLNFRWNFSPLKQLWDRLSGIYCLFHYSRVVVEAGGLPQVQFLDYTTKSCLNKGKAKQLDKQQNNHKPCHHVTPKELINSYIHVHQESWPPLCYVFWSVLSIRYLTCIFDECLLFTKTYFSLIPLIFSSPVSELTAIALTVGKSSRLAHPNSQKTIQRDWQWWRQNRCFMLSEPTWGKNRDLVIR